MIVAYNDGFFNDAKTRRFGTALGYPEWWARQVGFNQDIHPIFVKRDILADELFEKDAQVRPPDFKVPRSKLPGHFDFRKGTWLYTHPPPPSGLPEWAAPLSGLPAWSLQCLCTLGALVVGVAGGRAYERRRLGGPQAGYALLA